MNEKENADKDKPRKGQKEKGKGFYAALYASVGAMLLLAALIGYTNFNKPSVPVETIGPGLTAQLPDEGAEVSQSGVESYVDQIERQNQSQAQGQEQSQEQFQEQSQAHAGNHDEQAGEDEQIPNEFSSAHNTDGDDLIALGSQDKSDENNESRKPTATPAPTPISTPAPTIQPSAAPVATASPKPANPSSGTAFKSFDEDNDLMKWPVLGEVVMKFSLDRLVYDKTLEQYRTNNNICIAAPYGTAVGSAADGIVMEVNHTRENGRTVVVDHGNGWATTYSQLQDDVPVKAGDVVASGQTIGYIGSPSIYSSMLGNHVAFTVTANNTAVDPNKMLEKN